MRPPVVVLALSCLTLAAPAIADAQTDAQTGSFVGIVARDTLQHGIAKADVRLPQLNRSTTTADDGAFQISDIPAGRYAVIVRAIGFQQLIAEIDVKAGERLDAELILEQTAVELPTQRTTAEQRLPFGIQEMEDRRRTHLGGHFVTDSMLRTQPDAHVTYFLSGIPGLKQVFATNGSSIFIAGTRTRGGGQTDGTFPANECYVTIFLDGVRYFVGPPNPNNPPPDIGALWARDYAGIEYYAGGAAVPEQYNATGTDCGTLLLWTHH
jgi:hypothetical protein